MTSTNKVTRQQLLDLLINLEAFERNMRKLLHHTRALVGEQMRAYREQSGLSLRSAAKAMKVSAPYLSDVELGRRNPTHRLIYAMTDLVVSKPNKP